MHESPTTAGSTLPGGMGKLGAVTAIGACLKETLFLLPNRRLSFSSFNLRGNPPPLLPA
jgi:hypothetical protein